MNTERNEHDIESTACRTADGQPAPELVSGKVLKGVGGRYEVLLANGEVHTCTARGSIRHDHMVLAVGDRVQVSFVPSSILGAIDQVLPRKNALIRPAIANLDVLYLVTAAGDPAPAPLYLDKMISIAEFHHIQTVLVINKVDQDPQKAEKIRRVYEKAGFSVYLTETIGGNGVTKLRESLIALADGETAAFAGVSGVGKTSLMNCLFPTLDLSTGTLSEKIARGRHTTRHVQLYPLAALCGGGGFLADTPGFSMLDFARFDFYTKEDLPYTFREFVPYLGSCKYTKCSHTTEEGCAILQAIEDGRIARCRHHSYQTIWMDIKDKNPWEHKNDPV